MNVYCCGMVSKIPGGAGTLHYVEHLQKLEFEKSHFPCL